MRNRLQVARHLSEYILAGAALQLRASYPCQALFPCFMVQYGPSPITVVFFNTVLVLDM